MRPRRAVVALLAVAAAPAAGCGDSDRVYQEVGWRAATVADGEIAVATAGSGTVAPTRVTVSVKGATAVVRLWTPAPVDDVYTADDRLTCFRVRVPASVTKVVRRDGTVPVEANPRPGKETVAERMEEALRRGWCPRRGSWKR